MVNGVIYARYSCEKQTENSILGQVRECEDFARKNDINILKIYKDEAKSGRDTKHRHSFLQMIKDANEGLFNCIIVWKGDRFSRSRADAARYKCELKKKNIRVLSATEANMTGPEAILMDGINEAFAEYFSVELAAKVTRGMTQNAIDGKFNGGVLPVGYYLDENRKVQIDEKEAAVIRELFHCYAEQDLSMSELYHKLKAKGFVRKNGSVISKNALTVMMKNKRYIGIYEFKGTVNTTMFPPIIDKITFDKVQKNMKKNAKIPGKNTAKEIYLLTGRAYCGECGSPMVSYSGTDRHGNLRRYYRCQGKNHKKSCPNVPIKKQYVENAVLEKIVEFLQEDGTIDLIVKCIHKYLENGNPELKETKKQIDDMDKKIERLNNAIAEGVDFQSTLDKLKEFKIKREQLVLRYDELKLNQQIYRPENLREVFKKLSNESIETEQGKKKLIAMLVHKVIIYRGGLVQIALNVLNDNEPIIRETWCRAMDNAVHQWRITQVVEGAGLENR